MVGKTYLQNQNEIYDPSGRQDIKIIPVVLGAKKDGLAAILIGAALLVAAPYAAAALSAGGTSGMVAGAAGMMVPATTSAVGTMVSGAMMNIGVGLIKGGIAQALATTPEEIKDDQNYSFNGAANTVSQGVPVPICYGQLMIGGAVISSGVTS